MTVKKRMRLTKRKTVKAAVVTKEMARKALVKSRKIDISFLNKTLNAPKMNKCGMGFCGHCASCSECFCDCDGTGWDFKPINPQAFANKLNGRYLEVYVTDVPGEYRLII